MQNELHFSQKWKSTYASSLCTELDGKGSIKVKAKKLTLTYLRHN